MAPWEAFDQIEEVVTEAPRDALPTILKRLSSLQYKAASRLDNPAPPPRREKAGRKLQDGWITAKEAVKKYHLSQRFFSSETGKKLPFVKRPTPRRILVHEPRLANWIESRHT